VTSSSSETLPESVDLTTKALRRIIRFVVPSILGQEAFQKLVDKWDVFAGHQCAHIKAE